MSKITINELFYELETTEQKAYRGGYISPYDNWKIVLPSTSWPLASGKPKFGDPYLDELYGDGKAYIYGL